MVLRVNVFNPDQKSSCTNHTENRYNGQRAALSNLLNTVSIANGDSVEKPINQANVSEGGCTPAAVMLHLYVVNFVFWNVSLSG